MKDDRTPEEILADLEERRKNHVLMTTEESQEWNRRRGLRPISPKHWSVKAAKVKHVLNMGASWKKLAKTLYRDIITIESKFLTFQKALEEVSVENTRLRRLMIECDKCTSPAGEECKFHCSRGGNRDA